MRQIEIIVLLGIFLFCSNVIDAYRLHEEQMIDTKPTSENLKLRSVLWPKICVRTLMKKQTDDYPTSKQLSVRSLRKCFPFDTL